MYADTTEFKKNRMNLRHNLSQNNMRLMTIISMMVFFIGCSQLGMYQGWANVAIDSNSVIVATMSGEIVSLNKDTGQQSVKFRPQPLWGEPKRSGGFLDIFSGGGREQVKKAFYGTPVILDGVIYIASYDGKLRALSLETGERLSRPTVVGNGSPIVGGVLVKDGHVYVGSEEGVTHKFQIINQNGEIEFEEVMQFGPTGKIWTAPVIVEDTLIVSSLDNKVYGFDLNSGQSRWQPFLTDGAIAATPLLVNGTIFFGSFDKVFYAVDSESGVEKWRFEEADNWYLATPAYHEGVLFAPSLDGKLYALDADSGVKLWEIDTLDSIVGTPAIAKGKTDFLIFASRKGQLFVKDLRNSSLSEDDIYSGCNIEEKIETSVVSDGDTVYLYARDHSVRSLILGKYGNPDEKWDVPYFTDKEPEDQPRPGEWNNDC